MKRYLIKLLLACTLSFSAVIGFRGDTVVQSITESNQAVLNKFGDVKVYYAKTGDSFHLDSNCPRLSRSTVLSGSLNEIINTHSDPCDFCAEKKVSSNGSQKLQVNKENLRKYLENSYKKAFDREMDEGGLSYWMTQFSEGKITVRGFITNLIDTEEFDKATNSPTEKIKRLYEVIFMRDADEDGLNYWVSVLNENLQRGDSRQAVISTVNKIMEANELKEIVKGLGVIY